MTEFKDCKSRQKIILFDSTGKRAAHKCIEPKSDSYQLTVIPTMCEGCPVRSIKPKKTKIAPAAAIQNAKKDTDTSLDPCKYRQVSELPLCCGTVVEIKICSCKHCEYRSREVDADICHNCPHRTN